ncbi:hypothetical protein C8R45DRAFT_923723 [Mycena sanguinolenta]|nr:hypothetical protein C8R45DRAFT_923723 [Mycena sanguinolenta]
MTTSCLGSTIRRDQCHLGLGLASTVRRPTPTPPLRVWMRGAQEINKDVVFAVPELSCRERRHPIQPSIPSTRCLGCTSRPKRNTEVYMGIDTVTEEPLIEVRDVIECIAGLTAEHVVHEQGLPLYSTTAARLVRCSARGEAVL